MAEKEQAKPLTATSPPLYHPTTDEEVAAAADGGSHYLHNHRRSLYYCGCCATTIVIIGLLLLILAFTVFKTKDPVLTVKSVRLDDVKALLSPLTNPPSSLNATLTANISIKNPNIASFRFSNSTTEFYYEGETLGVAYAPGGTVAARRTLQMSVRVDVLAGRVAARPDVGRSFVVDGGLNVTSFTDVEGRVNLFGIYKRDVDVTVNCSMKLVTAAPGVVNKVCSTDVS